MRRAKIQLQGQFVIDRNRGEPLALQLVRQLQAAIEAGRVARGTQLPSTRSLARTLGVSRNTVLTAYDELAARGFLRGRAGAGMFACTPAGVPDFDVRRVLWKAHYPVRALTLSDVDGNALYVCY